MNVLKVAKSCRHYAMCKIDFLGSGVCSSGVEKAFVSFYPQGRMDLYAALAEGKIPVTEKCVEIADSCDLCGMMRLPVLLRHGNASVAGHESVEGAWSPPTSRRGARSKRGPRTACCGRCGTLSEMNGQPTTEGIALTYSHDPCALAVTKMPEYVVMPGTREEISALVRLFNRNGIPWVVRGNGTNVIGFHLCEGVVIDMNRMKEITFDEKNWCVRIGPGVAAFDLQRAAVSRGYRVNVAEPAALVCGSTMSSGILSLFSAAYGTSADNFVDAEFVAD